MNPVVASPIIAVCNCTFASAATRATPPPLAIVNRHRFLGANLLLLLALGNLMADACLTRANPVAVCKITIFFCSRQLTTTISRDPEQRQAVVGRSSETSRMAAATIMLVAAAAAAASGLFCTSSTSTVITRRKMQFWCYSTAWKWLGLSDNFRAPENSWPLGCCDF